MKLNEYKLDDYFTEYDDYIIQHSQIMKDDISDFHYCTSFFNETLTPKKFKIAIHCNKQGCPDNKPFITILHTSNLSLENPKNCKMYIKTSKTKNQFFSDKELNLLKKFIKTNYKILLDNWNNKIDDISFLVKRLKYVD